MSEPFPLLTARPSPWRLGRLPNEDAQSLVFEDTSLFEWDKFSGYDRSEGGVRANVGLQYTVNGPDGLYANALFGQSFQLAGQNSFKQDDLANVGRDSGLESARSDYVGRLQFAPNRNFSFVTRGRFDQDDLAMERLEVGATANFDPWIPVSTSLTYARYSAQPELGYESRREGLVGTARIGLTQNWFVSGSVLIDLDRYLTAREQFVTDYLNNPDTAIYKREDNLKVSSLSLGLGYIDECTTFSVQYIMTPRDVAYASGEKDRNQTLMFSLEFRTLGEVSVRQAISGSDDDIADR